MAWIVDVSRCLGLIDLKNCPSHPEYCTNPASEISSTGAMDGASSHQCGGSSLHPITCEMTPASVPNAVTTLVNTISATDGASSLQVASTTVNIQQVVDNALHNDQYSSTRESFVDSDSVLRPLYGYKEGSDRYRSMQCHNLNKSISVSSPCLQRKSRFNCKIDFVKKDTNSALSNEDIVVTSHERSNNYNTSNKNLSTLSSFAHTQSCETLSPISYNEGRQTINRHVYRRRVILSKDDCTVQYSPVAEVPSVDTNNHFQDQSKDNEEDNATPKTSRFESRSALVSRVCGVGTSVPPLPATDHPTRPPRLIPYCSQHASLSHSNNNNSQHESSGSAANSSRRAVKSVSGLPEVGLSSDDRCWSEHILACAGRLNGQLLKQFQEHRTSSLRGPPSRAASAEILLDNLDISEVSFEGLFIPDAIKKNVAIFLFLTYDLFYN